MQQIIIRLFRVKSLMEKKLRVTKKKFKKNRIRFLRVPSKFDYAEMFCVNKRPENLLFKLTIIKSSP